jgi:hypothetical protein
MRTLLAFLLAAVLFPAFAKHPLTQNRSSSNSSAAASIERKLHRVQSNGALAHPDQTPTEFTEQEINAYFAAGKINLPNGMRSVSFQGQPGIVTATTRVDFDQLKSGQNSSNPLLAVFSGVHDVVMTAQAHGVRGQGIVQVDSVSLDGVEIPRFLLQLFVEKYLQPKYPNVGLDSRFELPDRIDTAAVGLHRLTVTQK